MARGRSSKARRDRGINGLFVVSAPYENADGSPDILKFCGPRSSKVDVDLSRTDRARSRTHQMLPRLGGGERLERDAIIERLTKDIKASKICRRD